MTFFFQHPVGVLVVAREKEWSEGCRGKKRANHGDIMEEGPSTPKAVAGDVARRLVAILRSKGKGKGKGKA
ncbi:hypothetical protein C0989_002131 [Termitomyces sp. Mn162]|nr:hypothetical protein C0989_002131 [Termitomyces sp. Mn162]